MRQRLLLWLLLAALLGDLNARELTAKDLNADCADGADGSSLLQQSLELQRLPVLRLGQVLVHERSPLPVEQGSFLAPAHHRGLHPAPEGEQRPLPATAPERGLRAADTREARKDSEGSTWPRSDEVLGSLRRIELVDLPAAQSAHWNETRAIRGVELVSLLSTQLEYELHMTAEHSPKKSKVTLAVLELLGLGLCGIDRCYMGQTGLGVLKGLTFGGLFVWAVVDYFAVVLTCLSMSHSINAVGIQAAFRESSITSAFVLTIVLWLITISGGSMAFASKCCGGPARALENTDPKVSKTVQAR